MKPTRNWTRPGRKLGLALVVVTVIAVTAVVATVALPGRPAVSAQEPLATAAQDVAPITIQIDGQTVVLEEGKNVHPETYALLQRNPRFGSDPHTEWIFLRGLWTPFKRGTSAYGKDGLRAPSEPDGHGLMLDSPCYVTLGVPSYSQNDPDWACDLLDLDDDCNTIGSGSLAGCTPVKAPEGCFVACLASVFGFYGADTDPGILNSCMSSEDAYYNCDGLSGLAAYWCSGDHAMLGGTIYNPGADSYCSLLENSRPAIAHVTPGEGSYPNGHWIVVYDGQGSTLSDLHVMDPWDGSKYKHVSDYRTIDNAIWFYELS